MGTLQALIPYALWQHSGLNESYDYRVCYLPVAIYALGYLAFLLGTRMVRLPRKLPQLTCLDMIHLPNLDWATLLLSIIAVLEIIGLTRVYGFVPFLAFFSGEADVLIADDMLDERSALGQAALLHLTLGLLTACVLLKLLLQLRSRQGSLLSWQFLLPFSILGAGYLVGGKRQGVVMAGVFIATGLLMYSKQAIFFILEGLQIRSFLGRFVACAGAFVVALVLFNYIGMLRSSRDTNLGIEEAVSYLQFPLINLEYQCELAGWGPGDPRPVALFSNLLPKRWDRFFPDWCSTTPRRRVWSLLRPRGSTATCTGTRECPEFCCSPLLRVGRAAIALCGPSAAPSSFCAIAR